MENADKSPDHTNKQANEQPQKKTSQNKLLCAESRREV
jgi:hypothetical protein